MYAYINEKTKNHRPACDNFLGIADQYPSNDLSAVMQEQRFYRPRDHRAYLSWVHTSRKKVRMLEKALASSRCTVALLRNLDRVQELRAMHWKMTKKFVISQTSHPVTTGGTPISTWIPNHLMCTWRLYTPYCTVWQHCVEDANQRDRYRYTLPLNALWICIIAK